MGNRIASLYAEIGADTNGLKKGLKDSKDDLGGFSKQMKSAFGGITTAIGVATGALALMDKAFDYGAAGAQIEFTREKFDRLSKSIDTTGDALLNDLKAATGGTISDLELTASATDLLTLGLVKTHDEAVRLTSVAGQLGMNMNQLVLTLTNQTTMRFDALGVAVDGFDEKVKALVDAGMDADAAFKEAFLQQAEEQIAKVGSVADSTAADFMRLEAATQDLKATIQAGLTPTLADAAVAGTTLLNWSKNYNAAVREHSKDIALLGGSYEDYVAEMARATKWSEAGLNQMNDNRWNEVYAKRLDAIGMLTRAEFENAAAVQYDAEAFKRFAGVSQETTIATYEFSQSIDELTQGQLNDYAAMAEDAATMSQAFAQAQANSAVETANLTQSLSNMSTKQAALTLMDGLLQAAEQFPEKKEAYLAAWEDIGRKYGEVTDRGVALEDGLGMIIEGIGTGEIADATDAWDGLNTSIGQGKTTTEEIGTAIGLLPSDATVAEAGVRPPMEEMTEVFKLTKEEVNQIKEGLDSIPGTYRASVVVSYSGGAGYSPSVAGPEPTPANPGGFAGSGRGRASGGPVFAGQPYWVGEQGPEPFVPAQDGRILSKSDAQAAIGRGNNNNAIIAAIRDMKNQIVNELREQPRKLSGELMRSNT